MKKLVLTLTAMVALSMVASAQLSIGVKGGLNLANVGGDVEDTKMRPSFHFGGYLNCAFSENLSIQPELLYNSVGTKEEESGTDPDLGDYSYKATTKLNYISVPVMLLYSFGNFNIQAGPQFSFLASAKTKEEIEFDGGSEDQETDIKDGLKGMDLGLNVGLGANFGKLNASARYCLGLSNINDGEGDIKNNVIQLSLGYRLFGGE